MPIHLPPISRRRFLAGSLAAAGAALAPHSLLAEEAVDANRFVLLADTHINGDRDHERRGVKPAANLAAVVRQIVDRQPRPAGALVAGDCAYMQGETGDYTTLTAEFKPLREHGVAVSFALGNHDHREHFLAANADARPQASPVDAKHVMLVEAPRANLLLLDSLNKTNVTPGLVGEPQLAWLAKTLDARPEKPAIVVAHHDPQPGAPKISGLLDTAALYDVLVPRKQVKAFVFGHTHRWKLSEHEGLHLVNLPPTAWLFDAAQPRGWVDLQLGEGRMTLVLNTIDGKHTKHGEKVELAYRA